MIQQNAWVQVIATVISLVVSSGIVATLYKQFEAHLPIRKYAMIQAIVSTVVHGVEQSSLGNAPTVGLSQRKEAAVNAAGTILKAHGFNVAPSILSMFIEAAVDALPRSGLSGTGPVPIADQFLRDTQTVPTNAL